MSPWKWVEPGGDQGRNWAERIRTHTYTRTRTLTHSRTPNANDSGLMALTWYAWTVAPGLSVAAFAVLSVLHFGEGDEAEGVARSWIKEEGGEGSSTVLSMLEIVARGGMFLRVVSHEKEVTQILELLATVGLAGEGSPGVSSVLASCGLILSLFSLFSRARR